ncbi:MAG: response regulator transcription factor [Microscillaceae bacterium]|nr:response regulator transcription factor [Microscillaceae bacterium]
MAIAPHHTIRILVLEDEPEIAADLRETLEEFGYIVTDTVHSGEEALASVRRQAPDLALFDIKINGFMDGIQTAEEVKKLAPIPIIFLTAHYEKELLDRAKRTFPVNYLLKPFEEERLRIAIELAISNHSAQATEDKNLDEEAEEDTRPRENHEYNIAHDRIFIKIEGRWVRIFIDDILYLRAEGSGCHIITTQNQVISIRSQNLKNFMERLNHPKIVRTDRSYAVNIDKVIILEGNTLFLEKTMTPPMPTLSTSL